MAVKSSRGNGGTERCRAAELVLQLAATQALLAALLATAATSATFYANDAPRFSTFSKDCAAVALPRLLYNIVLPTVLYIVSSVLSFRLVFIFCGEQSMFKSNVWLALDRFKHFITCIFSHRIEEVLRV